VLGENRARDFRLGRGPGERCFINMLFFRVFGAARQKSHNPLYGKSFEVFVKSPP
jgi:hypothetical protein